MQIEVNGTTRELSTGPLTSLLDALRDDLDVTGAKAGCRAGGCGACTVLINGKPQRSCLTAVASVDGASITTVEGLGTAQAPSAVQQSFIHHYAAQCGYCTPGILMVAEALLEKEADPDDEQITAALSGNICRCTGYNRIVEAVKWAAAKKRGDDWRPDEELFMGTEIPK